MTGKERIMAMLHGAKTDRMGYTPCIDFYAQSGFPPEYRKMDIFDLQVLLGADMLRGAAAYKEKFDTTVRHTQVKDDNGKGGITVKDMYETPVGSLRQINVYTPESPNIPFPTEHLIKTMDELKILRYILEHTIVEPDFEKLDELIQKYPDHIISCSIDDTPFMHIQTKYVGIENFVYFYYENPEEIELTMNVMQELVKKRALVSAQSSGDVFISYENTNTAGTSADWILQYEFPQLNEYSRIFHQHNKKHLIHMCGKISLVAEDIAKAEFDGIIDVAPAPTGDADFAKITEIMAENNKIVAGGIECNTYCLNDIQQLEKELNSLIRTVDKRSFILGSGDAVPQGAKIENMLFVKEYLFK